MLGQGTFGAVFVKDSLQYTSHVVRLSKCNEQCFLTLKALTCPGVGALANLARPGGRALANPGTPPSFETRVVYISKTWRISVVKISALWRIGLSSKDWEKLSTFSEF